MPELSVAELLSFTEIFLLTPVFYDKKDLKQFG